MSLDNAAIVAELNTTTCDATVVTGATGAAVAVAAPVPIEFFAATLAEYNAAAGENPDAGNTIPTVDAPALI